MLSKRPRLAPVNTVLHQRGTSLLEVLVAILIVSFGMLGAAGLTAASMQYAKMTQFQGITSQLAADFGDRMRSNRPGFAAGGYEVKVAFTGSSSSVSVPACAVATACTPSELAAVDVALWTNTLRRQLPTGHAWVERDALNTWAADLWVMWVDPNLSTTASTSLAVPGSTQCPSATVDSAYSGPAPRCAYFRITQ